MPTWTSKEKSNFRKLIDTARITRNVSWHERSIIPKITRHYHRYKKAEEMTGTPAVMIAALHAREKSTDLGKFKKYLGNGQSLDKKTTWIPKGRGPFKNWEAGAFDALVTLKKYDRIKEWPLERVLFESERYNGFGYRRRGHLTPYVFSGTNHYVKGKYVFDGRYDPNAVDRQLGVLTYVLLIIKQDERFKIGFEQEEEPVKDTDPREPYDWQEALYQFFKWLIGFLTGNKPDPTAPVDPKDPEEPSDVKGTRNYKALWGAASQLGVKEWKGSPSNPKVEEYLDYGSRKDNKDSGLRDSVPWCAGFIAWVLEKTAGMGSTNSLMARSYEKWGVSTKSSPLPGDIVTFYRNGRKSGQGHVAFYMKQTSKYVYCLGGNQSDEVNISTYSKSRMTDIRRSSKAGTYTEEEKMALYKLRDRIFAGEKIEEGGKVTVSIIPDGDY